MNQESLGIIRTLDDVDRQNMPKPEPVRELDKLCGKQFIINHPREIHGSGT